MLIPDVVLNLLIGPWILRVSVLRRGSAQKTSDIFLCLGMVSDVFPAEASLVLLASKLVVF